VTTNRRPQKQQVELREGGADDAAERLPGPCGQARDADQGARLAGNGRQGAAVELIEVGGRTIAYRRAGGGDPLVLLHSAWSDGWEWRPQLTALSDEFDVMARDAPGCGGSEDPPPQMSMTDYADAVADLITALDLGRTHLCGLSFGGGLALAVYWRHPQLARSLVLASAYAGWKGSLPPEDVEARLAQSRGELDQRQRRGPTAICLASSPDRCHRKPSTWFARSCWRFGPPERARCRCSISAEPLTPHRHGPPTICNGAVVQVGKCADTVSGQEVNR
jgi:pimeloyl-ACP methyl ester carboxylesterase